MVGGLSFCAPVIRLPHYYPSPYLIIIGVCKTHPIQVDTDISKAHAGCFLQWKPHLCGLFSFPRFSTSKSQWPALILIRNAAEQRTAWIRLNKILNTMWPTWSPSNLLRFLAMGEGWPGGLFSLHLILKKVSCMPELDLDFRHRADFFYP